MIRARKIARPPRPFLPDMRNPFVSFVFFVVTSLSEWALHPVSAEEKGSIFLTDEQPTAYQPESCRT